MVTHMSAIQERVKTLSRMWLLGCLMGGRGRVLKDMDVLGIDF